MSAPRPLIQLSSKLGLLALVGTMLPLDSAAGRSTTNSGEGYKLGEEIPVSCLNRTMEGEHITDSLGKLQYIPFATCNETSRPLVLHYGVSETITCTIPSLPDSLYHLYEFYVHSDVPMTCRIPTVPLSPSSSASKDRAEDSASAEVDSLAALSENGPPFTPLTVALQGTLQLSHLHIWTDMNMLLHNIAADAAAQPRPRNRQTGQPGYAVAGTAYSTPEFEAAAAARAALDENERAVTVAQAAREPWTAGHGTKVVRGEPLTFSFHVAWLEGGAGIGWPERGGSESFLEMPGGSGVGSFFSRVFFFFLAMSVGAMAALYWERNGGQLRGRAGWYGDGILGVPPVKGKGTGVTFGASGRSNGYGGYSAAANGANGNTAGGGGHFGYGGFASGKRD
ncbi:hypothetical protein N7462_009187 [Penicillium macrosclerotiorum]|uniref:uncharacterized protein n=1 Tax=Penicillium macrosclerotiorum TaxID=303699 RepID=UPI002549B7D2|nr:uncharacterized protein N7462_009187 [Penicillium macrosclerotiorum]KAJ5673748.1 hypothetical protein N7462_009187 [Penicillium macrosclerotiorum]